MPPVQWGMNDFAAVIQGRKLAADDLALIRELIASQPDWSRWKLSRELATRWQWYNGSGQLKDMAARSLLLKLDERGLIELPPRRCASPNRGGRREIPEILHSTAPITAPLGTLQPIQILNARSDKYWEALFNCLLSRYHYLSFANIVGENIKYVALDRDNRPLACVLFGAPAWKVADRDAFIGWDQAQRERNLNLTTNNTRFLVLPWVRVPHLASCVLGACLRRLAADWQGRYGHDLALVETFVDRSRFAGTCYKAANFRCVGQTAGRTRQDRYTRIKVPVKDIYVYPLHRRFRQLLCS